MKGNITQIIGPVVDVDFVDYLPSINEAIEQSLWILLMD